MKYATVIAALLMLPAHALADGAIWIGVTKGGGTAIGSSTNWDTAEEAKKRAKSSCTKLNPVPGSCQFVRFFTDECLVTAEGEESNRLSWAVAATSAAAQRSALADCSADASGCRVRDTFCDGKAK